jgi:hypothetical protein
MFRTSFLRFIFPLFFLFLFAFTFIFRLPFVFPFRILIEKKNCRSRLTADRYIPMLSSPPPS